MISVAPAVTNAGRNLLLRAIGGEAITFTRFKIGNGEAPEDGGATLADLVNPLIEFPILSKDTAEEGYVKLSGVFDDTYIKEDFRWRELGLYCKGADGIEVLYAYANDGENAGMLKANASDVVMEHTISLVIAVGDTENVTAILSDSVLYAPKKDFDAHIRDKDNPHEVTKEQLGLDKVKNIAIEEETPTYEVAKTDGELQSGEPISSAFGKIARAIKSLIAHLKNYKNPHKITPSLISAAPVEHEHSVADISSGVLDISRGGTGVSTLQELQQLMGGINIRTYTGDGKNLQLIKLGYRPKFVQVIYAKDMSLPNYSGIAFDGINSVLSDEDIAFAMGPYNRETYVSADLNDSGTTVYKYAHHYVTVAIVDEGFYVSYCQADNHAKTNRKNCEFHYLYI